MTLLELVRYPLARYRIWRVQRWLLTLAKTHARQRFVLHKVVAQSGATVVDDWESAPTWVRKQRHTWVVILVGLFAIFFIWDRRKRHAERAAMASRRALAVLSAIERFLPRRIAVEELGDAQEEIERWARAGEWRRVYRRTATNLLRAIWNALRF
jgi:hypothetical protein